MNKVNDEIRMESGRELKRFLEWIKENPVGWECIRDSESMQPPMEQIQELITSLIDAGLYSMAYLAVCTVGYSSREMELVLHRIKMECLEDIPAEKLIGIIQKNI